MALHTLPDAKSAVSGLFAGLVNVASFLAIAEGDGRCT